MAILGDVARKDGVPELRVRTRMVYVILIIAFLGIMSRLAVLQIANGERYTYLSENNRVRIKRVPGTRGMIIRPFVCPRRCRRPAKHIATTGEILGTLRK
jgi:hypothetical protein